MSSGQVNLEKGGLRLKFNTQNKIFCWQDSLISINVVNVDRSIKSY